MEATGGVHLVRWIDEEPPEISFQEPQGTYLSSGDFAVRVALSDAEAGLDAESHSLYLDDVLVAWVIAPGDPFWHTAEISADLADVSEGVHEVRAEERDRAGKRWGGDEGGRR